MTLLKRLLRAYGRSVINPVHEDEQAHAQAHSM